jgi:hypothetical protein
MGQPGSNNTGNGCDNSGWGDGQSGPVFLSCKKCHKKDCINFGKKKHGRKNGCFCVEYKHKDTVDTKCPYCSKTYWNGTRYFWCYNGHPANENYNTCKRPEKDSICDKGDLNYLNGNLIKNPYYRY